MNEMNQGKATGFYCWREPLFVGDVLSVYGGYCGFMKVVERGDGFYLVDDSGCDCGNEDIKLERNQKGHLQKVDPNNRYSEPPMKIYCTQCNDVCVGKLEIGNSEIEWNDNCYEHDDSGDEPVCQCKLCHDDPARKPAVDSIEEYFCEQYVKRDVRITMSTRPCFNTLQEVDSYIDMLLKMQVCLQENEESVENERDK